MEQNTFTVIKSAPMSAYRDRIVICKSDGSALENRMDVLSMWGGADKQLFGCPSWEMGEEELVVAIKWCKQRGLQQVSLHHG
jgi:hypothetical protein